MRAFVYWLGSPEIGRRSDTLWEQLDKTRIKALGLEHRRVHDTRHTFITLARQDGAREDAASREIHSKRTGDESDPDVMAAAPS